MKDIAMVKIARKCRTMQDLQKPGKCRRDKKCKIMQVSAGNTRSARSTGNPRIAEIADNAKNCKNCKKCSMTENHENNEKKNVFTKSCPNENFHPGKACSY